MSEPIDDLALATAEDILKKLEHLGVNLRGCTHDDALDAIAHIISLVICPQLAKHGRSCE